MKLSPQLFAFALLAPLAAGAQATPAALTVQVSKPGAAVNKNMYGLFFEDINFAADGGLYPELVKNKSFEFNPGLLGWRAIGGGNNLDAYAVRTEQPVAPSSPHYVRLTTRKGGKGRPASKTRASGAWASGRVATTPSPATPGAGRAASAA